MSPSTKIYANKIFVRWLTRPILKPTRQFLALNPLYMNYLFTKKKRKKKHPCTNLSNLHPIAGCYDVFVSYIIFFVLFVGFILRL